jgi:hypothetical protein
VDFQIVDANPPKKSLADSDQGAPRAPTPDSDRRIGFSVSVVCALDFQFQSSVVSRQSVRDSSVFSLEEQKVNENRCSNAFLLFVQKNGTGRNMEIWISY